MATPNNPQNGGINDHVGNVANVAAQVAQGVPVSTALMSTLKQSAITSLLGPTALFAGSLIGALKAMRSIVEQSGILERGLNRIASIQQIQGKFETLLKSATLAQKRIQELYKFVATSPFSFNDVAEGSRILEALTKGALTGATGMKLVGDAAAATGQSFAETGERVGKLYAALRSGRSLDRIIVQMQMTGMVTEELAAKLEQAELAGTSFNGMWSLIEKSLEATKGGMEAQSKTLEGLSAKIAEAGKAMEQAFGQPFVAAQTKALEATLKATQNLTPVLAQIGSDLAPLYTFFGNLKNSIALNTIATQGFAGALKQAWNVAAALFVGISAATVGKMASSFQGVAQGALDFGAHLGGASKAAKLSIDSFAAYANAALLAKQSTDALAAGSVGSGIALKAQSVWTILSQKALDGHRAAMIVATNSVGGFSKGTYVASMLTGGLVKVLKLAGTAVVSMAEGLGKMALAMLSNPFTATLIGLGALYVGIKKWTDHLIAVSQEYINLMGHMSAVNDKLNQQIRAIQTLDDWRQAVANVAQELAKVNVELEGAMSTEKRDVLQGEKGALEGKLRVLGKSKNLGLSRAEIELASTDVAAGRRSDEQSAGISMSFADDKRRAALLRHDAAGFAAEGAEGKIIAQDKVAFDRSPAGQKVALNEARILAAGPNGGMRKDVFNMKAENRDIRLASTSELVALEQQIADAQLRGGHASDLQIRRQQELVLLAQSHAELTDKASSKVAEAQHLEAGASLKETELAYDVKIAAIRAAGGETATAEMEKQVALLKQQLAYATMMGNTQEAAALAAQLAAIEADKAHFRGEKGVERAVETAEMRRDPRRAQALRDAQERTKLRDQYKANGLSADQADSDFALAIKAQAGSQLPGGGVSSLQAIGGGGGYGGADPMLAAQVRIEKINEASRELLTIIAKNTGGGVGLK